MQGKLDEEKLNIQQIIYPWKQRRIQGAI